MAPRWLAAAAFLGATSGLLAQSVIMGGSTPSLTPRVIQQDITPDPASSDVIAGPETGSTFALGQIKLRPQLSLRYIQVDGLPTGLGTTQNTSISTISPGLGLELGSNWVLNYNPSWINYSAKSLSDTTSQAVTIIGAIKLNEWTFRFTENYQSSEDILVETATQTKQHNWVTDLTAYRKVGQRSKYDGTVSLNERYLDGNLSDSKTLSTMHWLRVQITQKVNAGVGVGLTKTDIKRGDDMHSEEYMASIRWQSTRKIDLSIQGGFETRHFDTAGVGSLNSPTMQITLGYRPFDNTRITAASTRSVSNSFFNNEVTRNSGWSVSLNQRLLEKLNLSMTYNDMSNDYTSFTTAALPTTRKDNYTSFNTSLGVKVLKYWTLAAIYQSTKNSSAGAQAGFGFSTDQYGVELTGAF